MSKRSDIVADGFLKLANSLLAGNTEAHHRTSVGRSYYALFLVAREVVVSLGFNVPENAHGHQKVYLYLQNAGLPVVVDVAADLTDLRGERNEADYEPRSPNFSMNLTAQIAYKKAKKAMDKLAGLSSTNLASLKQGIANYRKVTGN
jgi:hypothetical protein